MEHVEFILDTYDFSLSPKESLIPKILHMIWVGNRDQPPYIDTYKNKWAELMPTWQIRLWTNRDINNQEFSPEIIARVNESTIGAQKADIMRYSIIYKYGGVYLDTDVIPYRSLDPLLATAARVILCHDMELTWQYISIGFFASVPNDPLFDYAIRLSLGATLNTKDVHMHTGPRLMGEAVYCVKPDIKYLLLHTYYFYRNIAGEVDLTNTHRKEDFNQRFATHFYAKDW